MLTPMIANFYMNAIYFMVKNEKRIWITSFIIAGIIGWTWLSLEGVVPNLFQIKFVIVALVCLEIEGFVAAIRHSYRKSKSI